MTATRERASGDGSAHPVQAVQRTLRLLEQLGHAGANGASLAALARAAGLSEPTAMRYLATLADGEFAERDAGTGRYRLGLGVLVLGERALGDVDPRPIVLPYMEQLRTAYGRTVNLAAFRDGQDHPDRGARGHPLDQEGRQRRRAGCAALHRAREGDPARNSRANARSRCSRSKACMPRPSARCTSIEALEPQFRRSGRSATRSTTRRARSDCGALASRSSTAAAPPPTDSRSAPPRPHSAWTPPPRSARCSYASARRFPSGSATSATLPAGRRRRGHERHGASRAVRRRAA